MNLWRFGAVCLVLLLFLPLFFGYAPDEFIAKETHLLEKGEMPKSIISINKGNDSFFVVRIESEGQTTGYIALQEFKKEVVTNEVLNKQLFQTAEFIEKYQEFKEKVRDNPALIWFIVNWGEVSTIENKLSNEGMELDLIQSTLGSSAGKDIVSKMEEKLGVIRLNLEVLGKKMNATDTKEGSFLTGPVVGGEKKLKESVLDSYALLEQLHNLGLEYESLQQQLAIAIANDPSISAETKKQLNKTADLPDEFAEVEKWFTSAQGMHLKKALESIYLNASKDSADYASDVTRRLKREEAFNAIYGVDADFKKKTSEKYSSLKEAFDQLNSKDVRDYWVEQEKFSELVDEWNSAEHRFAVGDYERAVIAAGKAKKLAIEVLNGGLRNPNKDNFNYDLLFNGALLIIILLIILVIVRNRERLLRFVGGGEDEERVELHDFP